MLLYNVTVTIDLDTHNDWLEWMRNTHIPDVMATGMFISYRMSRLLHHEHEDSEIYSIQYLVKDAESLERYQREFAPALQADHTKRYSGKFATFRTLMQVMDHNENID